MKKSTIGIFVGIGISILAITFIPGLVKYLVPSIDTSSSESGSDITPESLTELELGHTYKFTVPTGDEATTLQTLITTDGNYWYVEFEENNYIGVKYIDEYSNSNSIDTLLYTATVPVDLDMDRSDDKRIGTFTITYDTTIYSNNIDLLPYLTDITEEELL